MKRPHILITNDDGIQAAGIKHLWQALRAHAKVTVVAPAAEQSAVGLSTTLRMPLRIEKVLWEDGHDVWSVSGTPADCVKLALKVVLTEKPDLIVAGINRGSNMGRTVLYSGTVAAAIEGVMQSIPSVAFSCYDYYTEPDYALFSGYVPRIVQYVLDHPMPAGTLLNVNFPERHLGPPKGVKMTVQSREWWGENPDQRTHPNEGHAYYWLGGKLYDRDDTLEGDAAWLRQGYVTAVPIHIADLTDHAHLKEKKALFESLF